jgi:Domain of unknown function (DUF2382)/PRC-barrel domain
MLDIDTVLGWRGRPVLDRDGEKVGTLGEIYLDDATDRPAYAGVHTGLFNRRESVVPLEGAQETPDGIRLPHTAERISEAPNVDPDVALDDEEQQRLADHFAGPAERGEVGAEAAGDADSAGDADVAGDTDSAGHTDSEAAAEGDRAEVVRSEEEVSFKTRAAPRERVRLRKHVVTEHVEKTVPVRREEVRLETDPPREGRVVDVQDAEED